MPTEPTRAPVILRRPPRRRLHIHGIKEMPAGYDAEVAELFRDLRAASNLSEADLAATLATRPEVVQALEQGALYALPPWPETSRVVNSYGLLLNLDVRPLLRRIYAQLEAGSRASARSDARSSGDDAAENGDFGYAATNSGGAARPNSARHSGRAAADDSAAATATAAAAPAAAASGQCRAPVSTASARPNAAPQPQPQNAWPQAQPAQHHPQAGPETQPPPPSAAAKSAASPPGAASTAASGAAANAAASPPGQAQAPQVQPQPRPQPQPIPPRQAPMPSPICRRRSGAAGRRRWTSRRPSAPSRRFKWGIGDPLIAVVGSASGSRSAKRPARRDCNFAGEKPANSIRTIRAAIRQTGCRARSNVRVSPQ